MVVGRWREGVWNSQGRGDEIVLPPYHGNRRITIDNHDSEFSSSTERIDISREDAINLWNMATGYFSPCDSFHDYNETMEILQNNHLEDGTAWTVPLLFPISNKSWDRMKNGHILSLYFENRCIAHVEVREKFSLDMDFYLKNLFGTSDMNHPGVKRSMVRGNHFISCKILSFNRENFMGNNGSMDTESVRNLWKKMGFETICAFQTRNAPHRGHEFLHKVAMLMFDGIAITPSLGPKKDDDLDDSLIIMAYEAYMKSYLNPQRSFFIPVNYSMLYAGPKEAFHHMIMRKNMGFTHFIIGRDHAGTGSYYGKDEAIRFVRSLGEKYIEGVYMEESFYCKRCREITTEKLCPHDEIFRKRFSGSFIRNMMRNGEDLDQDIMREEVFQTLLNISAIREKIH